MLKDKMEVKYIDGQPYLVYEGRLFVITMVSLGLELDEPTPILVRGIEVKTEVKENE